MGYGFLLAGGDMISLRDYFAGVALSGLVSNIGCSMDRGIELSFEYADKMIRMREVNKIVKEKKEKRFVPPSLDEVISYCSERSNSVNPSKWHDFYFSKGWMVGKNKMRDWKASIRTWEKNAVAGTNIFGGEFSR